MTRSARILLVALLATAGASAQDYAPLRPGPVEQPYIDRTPPRFEISAMAGYRLTAGFDVDQLGSRSADIADAAVFGIILGGRVQTGLRTELSYNYQKTSFMLAPSAGPVPLAERFKLDMHYVQASATYEAGTEKARGYVVGGAGAAIAHPEDSAYSDLWMFSFNFGLGGKFFINPHLGIRLESRLLVPIHFTDGGVWCGTFGCAASLSGKPLVQWEFMGGPVIAF